LILILAFEFCLLIWPQLQTTTILRLRGLVLTVGLAALLVGMCPAALRLQNAYFANRLAQSPYRATIIWLQDQPVKEAILLNSQTSYDWFYPYLRDSHGFFMLDDYADPTTTVEAKTMALLDRIAAEYGAVWVFDDDPALTTPAEVALTNWLDGQPPAHQADIDGGRVDLYILPASE
jgi:hypothetical protein